MDQSKKKNIKKKTNKKQEPGAVPRQGGTWYLELVIGHVFSGGLR